jgi:hypothetical protein
MAVLSLALVSCLPSLFAASLADILAEATAQSTQVQGYTLAREDARLSASLADTEDQTTVSVASGTVSATYDEDEGAYTFGTTDSSVSVTLPDEGETTFVVGTGTVSYSEDDGFSAVPYVSAGHKVFFGDTGDERSALLGKQTDLLGSYTYESNMIGFRTSIYQQIRSLVSTEKSIGETERLIADAKTEIEHALALKTMDEQSIAYKQKANALLSLENTLDSLEENARLLAEQYGTLTGLEWDGVSDIPEPDLSFTANPNGNTAVALKSLALQIARENYDVQRAILENKVLDLTGTIAFDSSDYAVETVASGTYAARNYSFGASAGASYDLDSGTVSPTFTVSGAWNNDSTALYDTLNLQKLQNEAMIAQNEYNHALSEYLYEASRLNGDIAAWQLSHSLLENTADYHREVLGQQQELFDRGLARQTDVDDAAFAVAQDAYDQTIDLLDGLVLQNRIETLQL